MAAQAARIRAKTSPVQTTESSAITPSRQSRNARRLNSSASPLMGRRMSAILPLPQNSRNGTPMNPAVRGVIEKSLDADLGDVVVHQDSSGAAVANSLAARAVTVGNNIFLGAGESASDLPLMAHESAHVLQQRGATSPRVQGFASVGGAFETEADAAAQAVTQGGHFSVSGRTAGTTVQRQGQDDPWYRRAGRAVGNVVSSAVEFGESVGWRMLEEFAPELVPIVRQGPVEWLKEKISNAVESVFNTLMTPVRSLSGIASSLVGHFANLVAWIRLSAARIANGDCGAVTEAAEKIQQVFEGLAAPVIDRIKHLADRVKNFFSGLWERFGAPVWQFLQRIGGAAWERIQQVGRWIWEKTAPIRRVLERAWTWIKNKLGIGEGAEGQDGILQWLQRKAQSVWDEHIKPFYERYRRQILIVTGVLVMLSPAGPVIAVGAAIAGLAAGIRWIRQYLRNREAIIQQRGMLQGVIIPSILGAVNRVSAFLVEKAQFVSSKLTEVVGGLNQAIGVVAGSILSFAVSILQWIVGRFQELVNWAVQGLMSLANGVAAALDRLRVYLQPILTVLGQIAQVVGNIMRLPMLLAGRLWNLIPACIRNPFINFFIPLILRQIAFFRELAATPEAWQQTRAEVMQLIQQVFRNFDLLGAIRSAFRLVVRALRIPVDLMGQLLEKAANAWDAVIAAPLRFIENALKSILYGVGRFMRNILSHLWYGVQGWLFNAVNQRGGGSGVSVSPPSSWTNPRAVFGFVLDVLGLSVDHVIELIDRRIPGAGRALQRARRFLTGALEWLDIALTQGPRGLWQHLVQRLGSIATMVLESAVGWIMTRVVAIVGARLAALAATAGLSAVLEAIKAVYSAIQTAIEYMPRILSIIIRVFDTVIQIAAGVIAPAAEMVETGFRMAMPIIIGFLANYAGLGGIGGRIVEIIQNVRQRIDDAILWMIDRAIAAIRSVWDMLRRGVQAVRDWWRVRKGFTGTDGRPHTILVDRRANRAVVTVRSAEQTLEDIIRTQPQPKRDQLSDKYSRIHTLLEGSEPNETQQDVRHRQVVQIIDEVAALLGGDVRATSVTSANKSGGRAFRVIAEPLTSRAGNTAGSASSGIQFFDQISALVERRGSRTGRMTFSMFRSAHLLAEKLHGPAVAWNLANTGTGINSLMRTPEDTAEDLTKKGAELRYVTSVAYHNEAAPQMDRSLLAEGTTEQKRGWLGSFVAQSYSVHISVIKPPLEGLGNARVGDFGPFNDGANFLATLNLVGGPVPPTPAELVLDVARTTAETTPDGRRLVPGIHSLRAAVQAQKGIQLGFATIRVALANLLSQGHLDRLGDRYLLRD